MKDAIYENMFKGLEEFAKEAEGWPPLRKAKAEETVRVFDSLLSSNEED